MITASEMEAVANMPAVLAQPTWMRERAAERMAMALRLCGGNVERAGCLARTMLIDVAMSGILAARACPRRKR